MPQHSSQSPESSAVPAGIMALMADKTLLAIALTTTILPTAFALGDEPSPDGNVESEPGIVIRVTGLRSDEGSLSSALSCSA